MRRTNRQCGPRGPNSGKATTAAQRRINKRHYEMQGVRASAADLLRKSWIAFALLPVLTGCTTGILNMSDEWCHSHTTAGASRCPEHGK